MAPKTEEGQEGPLYPISTSLWATLGRGAKFTNTHQLGSKFKLCSLRTSWLNFQNSFHLLVGALVQIEIALF